MASPRALSAFVSLGALAGVCLLPLLPAACSGASSDGDAGDAAADSDAARPDGSSDAAFPDGATDAPTDEDAPDVVGCAPPAEGRAALCLELEPEAMTFDPGDPRLDGLGVLRLAAYDRELPQTPDGGAEGALGPDLILPALTDGGEPTAALVSLARLPRVRLELTPGTVYILAVFYETAREALEGAFTVGAAPAPRWIGGRDLDGGLNGPLSPLALDAGEARSLRLPLTALRQLEVRFTSAVPFPGDGTGTLTALAFRSGAPRSGVSFAGVGQRFCAPLAAGPQTAFAIARGDVPLEVLGLFDDRNGTVQDLVPGGLTTDALDGGAADGSSVDGAVIFGAASYRAAVELTLQSQVPDNPDAGPQPTTCP